MSPVLCPSCSNSVPLDRSNCPSCDHTLSKPHGIFSFTTDNVSKEDTIPREAIERIAELTEDDSIRRATNEVIGERPDADRLLRTIFDTRNDAWRMLVADRLGGRCLDLYTGWGRRSLALAEHLESVYAVDTDLAKLRVLAARDDFASGSRVVPIHADDETLPFGEGSFDTVVADFSGRSTKVTKDSIRKLDSKVREGGSMLVVVDGMSRKLGVSGAIGLDDSPGSVSIESFRSLVGQCRRLLETLNYDDVRVFALWPTIQNLALSYELGTTRGYQHLVEHLQTMTGSDSKLATLLHVTARLGIIKYCVPNVLLVGTRTRREPERSLSQPVLTTGRTRAVTFVYERKLSFVEKTPIRARHSRYNEREHETIRELRRREPQIRESLPEGELIESPFGSIRKERPVVGHPLSDHLGESLESQKEVLSLGFDWLLELQQPHRRERVTFSPKDYVENSTFEQDVFDPSHLPDSVKLFQTPIHGDFLPGNIYVDEGEITTVIDWEYGCMYGNPIVDAGFFVARVIADDCMPTWKAMIELSNGQSRSAELGRSMFVEYCKECSLEPTSVLPLLPFVFLHRVNVDRAIDSTNRYTNKERERLSRVEKFWSDLDSA